MADQDFFPAASTSYWRGIFACVKDPDRATPDPRPEAERLLQRLADAASGEDETAQKLLPAFLKYVGRRFLPHSPESLAACVVLCCHLLDIRPTVKANKGRPVIAPESTLAEMLPSRRGDVEYESSLASLLATLYTLSSPDLLSSEVASGVTLSQWLQELCRLLCEENLPVPVTEATCDCLRELLRLCPSAVEPHAGGLAVVVLFNIDHVDPEPLWRELLSTFVKLSQVPKLVAKMFMALSRKDKNGAKTTVVVSTISSRCKDHFADAVVLLSVSQALELWTTFLYHLSNGDAIKQQLAEGTRTNVVNLADIFMSVFLAHIRVIDHTVPSTKLQKICDLITKTQEAISSSSPKMVASINSELIDLSLALMHFRGIDLSRVVSSAGCDDLQCLKSRCALGQAVNLPQEIKLWPLAVKAKYLGIVGDSLEMADHINLASCLLQRGANETKECLKDNPAFLENSSLHKAVLLSIVTYVADVLDVDSVGEEVFRPLNKTSQVLANLSEKQLVSKVKKAFHLLECKMTGECTNPELDDKFYFNTPLGALELLPLENLDCVLNSLALLVTFSLLSVSTHEDVNERLFVVLARCLDPTYRQSDILSYLKGPKIMAWFSKVRYHRQSRHLEMSQAFIAQGIVKSISKFCDEDETFMSSISNLGACLATMENERCLSTVVSILEALEKPLIFKDAKEEKLRLCRSLLNKYICNLELGIKLLFKDSQTVSMRYLILRTLTVILNVHENFEKSIRVEEWKTAMNNGLDFALKSLSSESPVPLKYLNGCVRSGDTFKSCFPSDFVKRMLEHMEEGNLINSSFSSLLEEMLKNMTEDEMVLVLDKYIADAAENLKEESLETQVIIWTNLAKAHLHEDVISVRQKYLETAVPLLMQRLAQLDRPLKATGLMLTLQKTILDAPKPLMRQQSEAMCMMTLSATKQLLLPDLSHTEFVELWQVACSVLGRAFVRRLDTLVLKRVPLITVAINELVTTLVKRSDQRLKLAPEEIKDLALCAYHLDRIFEYVRKSKDDFARIAPIMAADLLQSFQLVTIHPSIRATLLPGLHKLLDICDKHSKDFLARSLPEGSKEIFKQHLDDYNQYHKYSGKV